MSRDTGVAATRYKWKGGGSPMRGYDSLEELVYNYNSAWSEERLSYVIAGLMDLMVEKGLMTDEEAMRLCQLSPWWELNPDYPSSDPA